MTQISVAPVRTSRPRAAQVKSADKTAIPTLRLEFLGGQSAQLGDCPVRLRRRFCEILLILSTNPNGMNGGQLSAALYGDWSENQSQTVEVHRLSKLVAVLNKPYRLLPVISADFLDVQHLIGQGRVLEAVQMYKGELLPQSDAPAVAEYREYLHEALRSAVCMHPDIGPLWLLTDRFPDDLELLEHLQSRLPSDDVRCSLVNSRLKITRRKYLG